jgi:PPP family 3-phenylpropionic acid transporter
LYVAYYVGMGAFLPYFSLCLRSLGLNDEQLGSSQLLGALVAGPATILWARLGRQMGSATGALKVCALVSLPLVLLPLATGAGEIAILLLVHGMSVGAMMGSLDTAVLAWARTDPGASFSRLRMFGSVGFVASAAALGFILQAFPDHARAIVLSVLLSSVAVCATMAGLLPRTPDTGAAERPGELLGLLKDKRLLLALVIFTIHSAGCIPYYRLFGVFLAERSLPVNLAGIAMSLGVVAEAGGFLLLPRLLRRWPRSILLLISFGLTAARWLAIYFIQAPHSLVLIQVLQGATFPFFWGTAVQLIARLVPARLRGTTQGVMAALVFSGGDALGLARIDHRPRGNCDRVFF